MLTLKPDPSITFLFFCIYDKLLLDVRSLTLVG